MLKKFITKSISLLTAFAVTLTFIPSALQAQDALEPPDVAAVSPADGEVGAVNAESTAASTADTEEDVVVSENDTPLVRYAKLRRSWVVYREIGSAEIYAITKDNTKRQIQTLDFFTAFNANYHVKLVREGRLDELATGDPIATVLGLDPADFMKTPWRCRLVKTAEDSAVYLVCGAKRRVIIREGVFHRFGWEFRDVETVEQSELDAIAEDAVLDESSVFQEDVEIQTTENRLLRERTTERLNLQGKTQTIERLVKAEGDPSIYVITPDGTKMHVRDMNAVSAYNLNLQNVTEVTQDELAAFTEANEITAESSSDVLNVLSAQ
jgi:hypothetical protein